MIDDDSIDEERAELEARFRELEAESAVEALRNNVSGGERPAPAAADAGPDPLAAMKAQFEARPAASRFLLVLCPQCQAKNRTRLDRLRQADPVCGACGRPLAMAR
jgi:ribosomal protein S27E